MPTRVSRDDILRLRLARHGLAGNELRTPLEVVQRMLAVQAQDFPAGKWALGVRAPGSTASDVATAIDSGEIVRSWPMRGTLHLVPAADLNWMLQLTTARLLAGAKTRNAQLGLDDTTIESARTVAVAALEGGRRLSRSQFMQALDEAGISPDGQRGYHLIWQLAQTGTVCWGPHEGKQQSLVLLDEWVREPRRLARDEAIGEFLFRYLDGHGPATLKDFVWWSKLTVADAKIGLAVAGDRLVEFQLDDTSYYLPASVDTAGLGTKPRQRTPVLTLPAFDEYLLGYGNRDLVIDPDAFTHVVPGKNGIFFPIMVAAGRVTGTWRAPSTGSTLTAAAEPFAEMTARHQAGFARGIRDYAHFLGSPVTVPAQAAGVPQLA